MKMTAREPFEHNSQRDERKTTARARRRGEPAAIGFSHVMEQVGKDAKQKQQCADGMPNGMPDAKGLLVTELVMETAMINTAKAAESTTVATQVATAQTQNTQQADAMLMTPRAALKFVATSAGTMTEASREIQISLDPEHLGPVIIRLRVENGKHGRRIKATLVTRESDAAKALSSGNRSLEHALAKLGFSEADVEISHSPEEFEGELQR
jgi:flagellar hook-length control protein FliK